jgi:putative membrane protein insertion efficiency factor
VSRIGGNIEARVRRVTVVAPQMTERSKIRFLRDTVGRWLGRAPRVAGRVLIKTYRYTLSPLIGYECRHLPTCSHYAEDAIERFGLWAGGWMTLARLCRCHPWGTSGLDFVPASKPKDAHWFLPWRYGRWRGTRDRPEEDPPSSTETARR